MASYTYHQLLHLKVVNPIFEPKPIDYAKAILFKRDYFSYKRRKITTNRPYMWALAIQRTYESIDIYGTTIYPDIPNHSEMMPKIRKEISKLTNKSASTAST